MNTSMKLVRIRSATPLVGFRVRLKLTDGAVIERDFEPFLVGSAFAAVRGNRSVFESMRVEGGTVVWPNGADLCPDVLIWNGSPPWATEKSSVAPAPPSSRRLAPVRGRTVTGKGTTAKRIRR